jgi:hypothetical protein
MRFKALTETIQFQHQRHPSRQTLKSATCLKTITIALAEGSLLGEVNVCFISALHSPR